jgi:Tol biopolymer transport system component
MIKRAYIRIVGTAGAAAIALVLGGAALSQGAVNGTELVSRASGAAGVQADDTATSASVSAGGRFVAFQTRATNLDRADTDAAFDVYVRDTETDATILVSRASGGAGAKGNGDSIEPSISADGRYVAFRSSADNLHPDDPPGDFQDDVYVRDLQAGTTTLASRDATGAKTNGVSPSISADGRYVAFQTLGFVDEDPTTEWDIHVRDLVLGTTILASRASGPGGVGGSSHSYMPSISPSGRYVAFESQATNLDPADTTLDLDVYVRDLAAATTVLASRADGGAGAKGDNHSGEASMSDAPAVAFESIATNLHPDDGDDTGDVFVRDLGARTTTLASRAGGAAGAKGDSGSRFPSISADGSRVAFESEASNLVAADDPGRDVFVRDLRAHTTELGDLAGDGSKASRGAHGAAISPDGRLLAFVSAAPELGIDGLSGQVFVRGLSAPAPAPPPAPTPTPPTPTPPPPPPPPPSPTPETCQGRAATIAGTDGSDVITGTKRADVIVAGAGNDVVNAGKGKDVVCAGAGADGVRGGDQGDRLFGGPGNDALSGQAGNDRILGEEGDDALNGGTGKDACAGGPGRNRLRGC